MSYCKEEGKDQVIFATKDDLSLPSKAIINMDEDDEDQPPGLILPNGDINWDCPCLGGMATGPCGTEFRQAFSCFHYSEAEPKGSNCYDDFLKMQSCMTQYPDVYPPSKPPPDFENVEEEESSPVSPTEEGDSDSPGLISVMTSNTDDEKSEPGIPAS